MNLSDDWRFLFPARGVFEPPSLAPASSRGPLVFSPLPPPATLLSLPFPIPPPRSSARGLRSLVGATFFLPRSDLDSLEGTLLARPSSPSPPPSNLLAVLRRPRVSSCSLLVFFPYGENAEQVAFVALDSSTTVIGSTPLSPVVQRDGFRHPGQRIQQLAATATVSSWPSQLGDSFVDGFLLAATMYSVSWFRVESRGSGSSVLEPAAKQGFDAVVVHACWSRHFPSECVVLLETGELCLFNLDTRQGGKMRVDFGSKDNCGDWLSCDYGAQPWTVIVVTSKCIRLVDLRFGDRSEYKVLARVGMPGFYGTDVFAGVDRHLAFCRAGFDHFHFSVVTERYLILFDVRQPLTPVLVWQHGLESPNNIAMFRLSELRPSKEHEWASNSGFAILVGSFCTGEFSVFCYGPKEQGCPKNSHLYAWDIPSRFSLTDQRCGCSYGVMKEVFSMPVSRDGSAFQESTVGYYVLPYELSVLETSSTSFSMIRLTALGKLEMQRYRASAYSNDDILCDGSQHGARISNSSIISDTSDEKLPKNWSMKLHFLSEYLEGNLCNALVKHDSIVNKKMDQIIVSEDVSEYAKANASSCPPSVSDFLCNASVPMNIFEIASQRILNGLPYDILHVSFAKYTDMLRSSILKTLCEHLDVPTCLTQDKLRPFLLAKPSSISCNVTPKLRSPNALVGPVLPMHVLLAMKERNKDTESSSQGATLETDSISDRCREVLEAFDPVISIDNCNGWPDSQGLNDEKSFFAYELTENRITFDKNARNKEKGGQELNNLVHSSSTPYQDKIFTTFVCGKADSEPEHAATSLFDFGPVRMDFDSLDMAIQPGEAKVYKCLKKQFLTWQNNFRPYQDFCSSHKIQKPKQ